MVVAEADRVALADVNIAVEMVEMVEMVEIVDRVDVMPADASAENSRLSDTAKKAAEKDTVVAANDLTPDIAGGDDYTPRERWLLSLNPKQYTLQMIGARDEPAVQTFISKYPSLKQIAYYRTLYKEKNWYVVVYGQFSSRDEAKQATASLPKKLVASKPWIRPLSQVQGDIRKGH